MCLAFSVTVRLHKQWDPGSGIDTPASEVPDATLAAPAMGLAADPLPLIPRDSYTLVRERARGGLGRVFEAEDRRLGRPVAVKEILDDSPEARVRFAREARLTARLQHPGIVPIYEAGT